MAEGDEKSKVKLAVGEVIGPDFTIYDEKRREKILPPVFQGLVDAAGAHLGPERKKKYSHSFPAFTQFATGPLYGRALACSAYGDSFWSVTLRYDEPNTRPKQQDYDASLRSALKGYVEALYAKRDKPRGRVKFRDVLGYCPQGYPEYSEAVIDEPLPPPQEGKQFQKDIFLNDIYRLCDELYKLIFPPVESSTHSSGLLAITGTTDSSKSLITRGLIFLHLKAAAMKARERGQRKPHLITFEDPIEQYFVKNPVTKTAPQSLTDLGSLLDALYLDYTPREKDLDADNLKDVTRDALRQTPAVLFVGETREKSDWKDLLDFAGSGHLVITTSHASSIVEAMTGIFRDTETKTPAQRSEIARRILGIINIRSFSPQAETATSEEAGSERTQPAVGKARVRALLPALWKNTSQSRNNLIADGLASLLPALGREPEIGYYSRTHFANELTDKCRTDNSLMTDDIKQEPKCTTLVNNIRRKAREWDIEGV